jgi:glycine/D-amino acid oxidase-like deaminating enzyme/nitrite reductase/ring-hydroxylating ferredoxin subunit
MSNNPQCASPWSPSAAGESSALSAGERVDVCVVGAGIAGLSVAYHVVLAGRRVLVLDDGPIGGGQTQFTTAHLANAIDDRFVELEHLRGAECARLAAQSHGVAIDCIERTVAMEQIECDFERVDGYLFVPRGENSDVLEREEAAAKRAGLGVELLPRAPVDAFDTGRCLRFPRQGQFEPMRYLTGLARAITAKGGRIVTGVHVDSIEGDEPVKVVTRGGPTFEARAVIVATNTPVNDVVSIHTKQAPYLTYAIALSFPEGAIPHVLLWDTGDPYHYVRVARSATPGRELLIVGGEDHKTGQASDQAERFERLRAWARERFPRADRLEYQWSGQVEESLDGLGYIGRNPGGQKNVYIATGDSGMGMTHGTIAGLLIADLVMSRENAWEALYDPSRKVARAGGTFLEENLNVAKQYAAWLTPGKISSTDELEKGKGAILRRGLTKLAVYRDEQGRLHERSAVCPHLGAIVAWNDSAKTWDCPAHGSRFDCTGKVIEGPANSDLRETERDSPSERVHR